MKPWPQGKWWRNWYKKPKNEEKQPEKSKPEVEPEKSKPEVVHDVLLRLSGGDFYRVFLCTKCRRTVAATGKIGTYERPPCPDCGTNVIFQNTKWRDDIYD